MGTSEPRNRGLCSKDVVDDDDDGGGAELSKLGAGTSEGASSKTTGSDDDGVVERSEEVSCEDDDFDVVVLVVALPPPTPLNVFGSGRGEPFVVNIDEEVGIEELVLVSLVEESFITYASFCNVVNRAWYSFTLAATDGGRDPSGRVIYDEETVR